MRKRQADPGSKGTAAVAAPVDLDPGRDGMDKPLPCGVPWQSGDATDCKSVNPGSIPGGTSSAAGDLPAIVAVAAMPGKSLTLHRTGSDTQGDVTVDPRGLQARAGVRPSALHPAAGVRRPARPRNRRQTTTGSYPLCLYTQRPPRTHQFRHPQRPAPPKRRRQASPRPPSQRAIPLRIWPMPA